MVGCFLDEREGYIRPIVNQSIREDEMEDVKVLALQELTEEAFSHYGKVFRFPRPRPL